MSSLQDPKQLQVTSEQDPLLLISLKLYLFVYNQLFQIYIWHRNYFAHCLRVLRLVHWIERCDIFLKWENFTSCSTNVTKQLCVTFLVSRYTHKSYKCSKQVHLLCLYLVISHSYWVISHKMIMSLQTQYAADDTNNLLSFR